MFDRHIALLGKSSGLVDQRYLLHEVSLDRNTPKIKVCVDQLMKILWPEICRNLTPIYPGSNGSVFTDSVFRPTL